MALDVTRQQPAHGWRVLLIGGHSSAGKTVAARQLAMRFAVGLAEVDDFRLALQRAIAPQRLPTLHALIGEAAEGL